MINVDKLCSDRGYRFILSPNCSISWRELVFFYCLTCVVIAAIGIFFTLQGMWLVLPFSGLEMMVLGAALYATSRKVHRREIITLDEERVRIEKGVHKVDQCWEFTAAGTRIFEEQIGRRHAARRLILGAHGNYVEVGDFLNNQEKEALAFQLKGCIILR
jgi:uncharacterized membrane protein